MNLSDDVFGYWRGSHATIDQLFAYSAKKNHRKTALVDRNKRLTYEQLDKLSDDYANYLFECGITEGGVVGIYLDRCYQYIVS